MGEKFETYELTPPKIWLWRIRDVHDLIEIAESCNMHREQENFRYTKPEYDYRAGRTIFGSVGKLLYTERDGLHYETYHSEYGNSSRTDRHHVAAVGDALVLNLTIKMGVFISGLGDGDLDAQKLPEEMLRPSLQPLTFNA